MLSTNPLRYPGGKYFLSNYISQVLESHLLKGCTFYEPYAGSAAVSLEMLFRGLADRIVIVEKDPLIYSFWKAVLDHTERLCEAINRLDISVNTWHVFEPYKYAQTPLEYSTVELGLAGLFFNRTNYSGILQANPIGGKTQSSEYKIDCRFKKATIISHIKKIACSREKITVKWADAIQYLETSLGLLHKTNCFVYIDPPYYQKGKSLYRYYYRDQDHKNLSELIKKCQFPWLISYDEHPFITALYFGQVNNFCLQKIYCDYSANQYKRSANEILISNLIIPPPQYQNSSSNNTRTAIT